MKRTLWMLLVSLLLLAACGNQPAPAAIAPAGAAVTNITVQDLKTQLGSKEHIFLLDVRSAEEYTNDGHVAGSTLIPLHLNDVRLLRHLTNDGHVAGSTLIPLPDLARRASELPTDRPIVCICRSGNRSTTACNQLANQGFTQLRNVQGGMIAWGQAGYPIAYGQ